MKNHCCVLKISYEDLYFQIDCYNLISFRRTQKSIKAMTEVPELRMPGILKMPFSQHLDFILTGTSLPSLSNTISLFFKERRKLSM